MQWTKAAAAATAAPDDHDDNDDDHAAIDITITSNSSTNNNNNNNNSSHQLAPHASASASMRALSPPMKNTNTIGGIKRHGFISKSASPAKKFVIKGLNVMPCIPDDFEQKTWDHLRRAVFAIQAGLPLPGYSLEELYQACERLCICKRGETTYLRLKRLCKEHIIDEKTKLGAALSSGEDRLQIMNDFWIRFSKQQIRKDRTYVIQAGLRPIWEFGLDYVRDLIMADSAIRDAIIQDVVKEIGRERDGDKVLRDVLRSLVSMLIDVGMYVSIFEKDLITASDAYYMAEGDRRTATLSDGAGVASYLTYVDSRLTFERDLCSPTTGGYLRQGTKKGLVACLERYLVQRHTDVLLTRGFADLIKENRVDDLARLFVLFKQVGAVDSIKRHFAEYIEKSGLVIINTPERDASMIPDLLAFKASIDQVLSSAFANHDGCAHVLKESFERFINRRQNKPAELLAKHIDGMLRMGKGVTEAETEVVLDQCLVLFRYINGKDVFEAFYKKDLAKRMLLGKSASFDSEKSMLVKLKTECGSAFTSKLEGMFRDIDTSRDIVNSFRTSARMMERLGSIELNVNVLTSGFWPSYPVVPVNLPHELQVCQQAFKEFYMSKFSGRQLTWSAQMSQCVLKAKFKSGQKELSVSLFQALVLLLFNSTDSLTYKDIETQTGITPVDELDRTLQSLACGKLRILQKHPHTRNVSPTDTFEFNNAFANPLVRIKVNQIQMKETREENVMTNERVFADRQYQVDAAIVRIMKSRKTLSHTLLISSLFEQLKFPIKPSDLKKRIESLIEREYLERDKSDSSTYVYLA